jgi:pimeloyl-ACP methyl ester carboxylesterase
VERVRSADGVHIAYQRSGRGPALVIVNGAFGTRATGAPVAAALDGAFTVYRFDRRGRGDSEDSPDYEPAREVEDLAAVVHASGGEAFVFGHSSGGALSLEAAAAGIGVRGLVVHEPPYVPGPGTSLQTAQEFTQLIAAGRRDEVAERFLLNTGAPAAVVAQTKSWDGWPAMLESAHTLAYDVRMCNEGVVPVDRLSAISCPVLATAGSLSPEWALTAVRTIAGAVPHGEWRVMEGQSHNLPMDVLAGVLRNFLPA